MSEEKEFSSHSPDKTKIHYSNGESKVFTGKDGKPVAATKYIERLMKKQVNKILEEPDEAWLKDHDKANQYQAKDF